MKLYKFISLLPLGLPGGGQVDGLPPAASTGHRYLDARTTKELLEKLGQFFLKKLSFSHISTHFSDFVQIFIDIAEVHARRFARL